MLLSLCHKGAIRHPYLGPPFLEKGGVYGRAIKAYSHKEYGVTQQGGALLTPALTTKPFKGLVVNAGVNARRLITLAKLGFMAGP